MLFRLLVRVIALGNDHVGFKYSQFLTKITAAILVHLAGLLTRSIGATLSRSHMNEELLYYFFTLVFFISYWFRKLLRCDEGVKKAPHHRQSFSPMRVQWGP